MQASESIPAPGFGEETRSGARDVQHVLVMHVSNAKQASHITLQANECAGNRQPRAFAFSYVMCLPPVTATCCHYSLTCTCIFTCYLISLTSAFAISLPILVLSAYSSHPSSLQAPRHRVVEFRPDFPGIDCCAHRHLARRIARLPPYQALPTQACQQTTVNITNVLNRRVHQQK